jgi:HemY protein
MKIALWLLALLLVGVLGAHFLIADRGQVLVRFHGWTLETSVPVLVLLLVLAYALVRLVVRVVRVPRNIGRAASSMRVRRAQEDLSRGLLALEAGDWATAERLLGRTAQGGDQPVLHYIGAARAAQAQGAGDRRDRWLALAEEQPSGGEVAVLLARAEMHLAAAEYDQALKTLRELEAKAADHPRGLALQARALEAIEDWGALRTLVPRLRSTRAIAPAEIDALERSAHVHALAVLGTRGDPERVRTAWDAIGRELQSSPELQRAYANALADAGDVHGAEESIRGALERQWDSELARRYGKLAYPDPVKQLARLEQWLQDHPNDGALLLAAARLCMRNELWGKARSYLEACLALDPSAEAYELYGALLERLGDQPHAAEAFRKGLALATGSRARDTTALPSPRAAREA